MVRALIIGGGIAGSATALALHKADIPATVYEACPAGGEDAGAFLVLSPNGMRVLDQLDATDAVVRNAFPLRTMEFQDARGRLIAERSLSERSLSERHEHLGYHHIRRADLYRSLQDEAVRRAIPVEHGKRLSDVQVRDSSVRAEFTDGTSAEGDVLIGADGLRSAVRCYTDPEAQPRYVGEQVFYGYSSVDIPAMPTDSERFRFVLGRNAIFGQLADTDGKNWWFARVPAPELSRDELAKTSLEEWREYLVGVFRKDKNSASEIIAATDTDLIAGNVRDLAGVNWRRGPVLLVGDAAHAVSPSSGQGASVALEDALVLGKTLRDRPSHSEAFTAYEQLRRDRIEQLVIAARNTSRPKPPNAVQRWRRARRLRGAQPQRGRTPADPLLKWNEHVRAPDHGTENES